MVRGPNVAFKVATEPPGAEVTTDLVSKKARRNKDLTEDDANYFLGCAPTPCEFQVSRRSEFITEVSLEGYHTATIEITSGLGGGNSAVSATGAVVVAGSVYGTIYGVASFIPAIFGSSMNAGAAAAATQAATGVGVLFLGVDVASGAMLSVRPNPLVLVMIPDNEPLPEDTYVDSEDELKALMENRGVMAESDADS